MELSAEAQAQIAGLGINLNASRGNSLLQDYTEDGPESREDEQLSITPSQAELDKEPEVEIGKEPLDTADQITEAAEGESELEATAETDESGETQTPTEDVEWIKADGKKIKVDYSDRDRTKKAHELAAGFRAKTVEVDNLRKEFDEYKESRSKKDQVLDLLNEHKDDPAELVRLFTGGKTDIEEWRKAKNAEEEAIATMSEDEFAAYQRQIHDQQKDAEIEALKAQIEGIEESGQKSVQELETKRRNDLIGSTFNRFRFAGKIDDPTNAQTMDEMMWHAFNKAMTDNHEDWTSEAAELEMKLIHGRVSRAFGKQAEKKVEQIVKKKQQVAKQQIAEAVTPAKSRTRGDLSADIKEKGIFGAFSSLYS